MSDGSGTEMLSSVADHRVERQLKEWPPRDFEGRLDTSICAGFSSRFTSFSVEVSLFDDEISSYVSTMRIFIY